ncbi:hypothetical protein QBC35DRAFT_86000 [Podospora australis]|uniref:Transmembrane protein n=1 Tax=Podospora australis TaxID=1536484 RepID=A0AAN7AFA2_9PEZI|nr:hypothetical protein QBC35DRAFT_86000 [Podospora australis]
MRGYESFSRRVSLFFVFACENTRSGSDARHFFISWKNNKKFVLGATAAPGFITIAFRFSCLFMSVYLYQECLAYLIYLLFSQLVFLFVAVFFLLLPGCVRWRMYSLWSSSVSLLAPPCS